MTTRSNALPSPLLSSKEQEEELNCGYSTSKAAVSMKPHLRGRFEAKPVPAFPSVLTGSLRQKSDCDQKVNGVPKLMLTQPLQFQKARKQYNDSSNRAAQLNSTTANSVENSLLNTGDDKRWQVISMEPNNAIHVCETPDAKQKRGIGAIDMDGVAENDIMFTSKQD